MNCEVCNYPLTLKVAEYSERFMGLKLCFEHQKLFREMSGLDDKPEEVLARMKELYNKEHSSFNK